MLARVAGITRRHSTPSKLVCQLEKAGLSSIVINSEYKSVLFDSAVTGKIKVCEFMKSALINTTEIHGVSVHSCTLTDLLDCNIKPIPDSDIWGQLYIPEYQRPYIWNEKQIDRLLSDLIEYSHNQEEKPLFYLGSIILHKEKKRLNIIDGQQRITTMLLLDKFTKRTTKCALEFSSTISIENIKRNLSYLKSVIGKEIFEYRDLDIPALLDFSRINITLVITETEDLAYTFFETQNTGGVRLSGSDITKAHHLRAIPEKKLVNYQARRWEAIESDSVETIIQKLTKIRFWDNRHWRTFPFYRDFKGIKQALINEFTERTLTQGEDISFYYSAVKNKNGRLLQTHESTYKQLKQPLSDGNNALDYINDYIHLHQILFENEDDHKIEDRYFEFRNSMLHGKNGTVFLKELFEITLIGYVSRFGFIRLYEASLWLYRAIFSLRVSTNRNVRENSVFKFIYDNQFIDNILEVYTPDELFLFLKRFSYRFDTNYTQDNQSKAKHIKTLQIYFQNIPSIEEIEKNPKHFDTQLVKAIAGRVKAHAN